MLTVVVIAAIGIACYGVLAAARRPPSPSVSPSPPLAMWVKASKLEGYYSRPEFCLPDADGNPCIHVGTGDMKAGAQVEVYAHDDAGDAGSLFVASYVGEKHVMSDWPFIHPTLDQEVLAQESEHGSPGVFQLEADPNAIPDNLCLSAGASQKVSSNGITRVTLARCDAANDDSNTWMVWNSYGDAGRAILMVGASDRAKSAEQLACLDPGQGTVGQCVSGDLLVVIKQVSAIEWTHWEPTSCGNPCKAKS